MKSLIALKGLLMSKVGLSVAAVVAVAGAGTAAGTLAVFTATPTTIESNAFATGSVSMSRSGSGAIFNVQNAKIGETVTGSVTITNTGSLAAVYTLTGTVASSNALVQALALEVYKDDPAMTGTPIYSGAFGNFSVGLGTFAADGGAHTFTFKVTLPTLGSNAADNALQSLTANASFTWSAVQA